MTLLGQHAPTWLVQMPALLDAAELEALQRKVAGATQERMLRELAEAVEVLTAERPLVLVLEDLQWSDRSTVDLIAFVAQRRERARLLVIGTYRPVDVIMGRHPLNTVKPALQLHRQCEELRLELLSEGDVEKYLAVRCGVAPSPIPQSAISNPQSNVPVQQLARLIYRRTDGNPLFMVNVVDSLVRQGVMVEVDRQWRVRGEESEVEAIVPENLRQLIVRQSERLSATEQRVLAAASVAGVEFSAAAVAAGLEEEVVRVEEHCEELVRHEHFLQARGLEEGPEGTVTGRYRFLHALYPEVLYKQVSVGNRMRLHRRIGEWEEAVYGRRARERATELAVHFERGRDYQRAVRYLQYAGETAIQRSAYREAISLLTKGLELLRTLPETPERNQYELSLQAALGLALTATKGYAAPEVGRAYARARELCRQVTEAPDLFLVLPGLFRFYFVREELPTARELAEQCLTLAQRVQEPVFLVEAHQALGITAFHRGELAAALEHLEQSLVLYDSQRHGSSGSPHDLGVNGRYYGAYGLWFLGYPDRAFRSIRQALTLAQELSHPFSLAGTLHFTAMLHHLFREERAAQERAEELIALSREQGFPQWLALGGIMRGRALVAQGQREEGITQIRRGLAAYEAVGAKLGQPYLLAVLAEAYGKAEQPAEGLSVVAEALTVAHNTGDCFFEAELYRLKGELTLQFHTSPRQVQDKFKTSQDKSGVGSPESEAEKCFHKAVEIAQCQSAKSLELRTVLSLSRLWQRQGKKKEARKLLAEIYGWFTEGFDTTELQEARRLLSELS